MDGLEIVTFGCRLNAYESEAIRGLAQRAGLKNAVFVNTCAVTAEAERQARQALRKARRARPEALIVATGCAAQITPERYAAMPEVDHVLGNAEKLDPRAYTALRRERVQVAPIATTRHAAAPLIETFPKGLTRGFIQIQNGCDHRCSYCVIPYGRGASRSVPFETVIAQARTLAEKGFPEIVLSGVDIASYGSGETPGTTLGTLVSALLDAAPEVKRLRLSSLDPAAIDDDLWRVLEREPRLMPHWHLSLQAGDDDVLRRMARRHRTRDVLALCERARRLRPSMTFGADLIAGFPTETEAMFERTLAFVETLDLTWLHVFPYSPRTGTAAAKMPQVPMQTRRERAARLRKAGQNAEIRHIESLIGQRMAVHVEEPLFARAPTFAPIRLQAPATVGSVINIIGLARQGQELLGKEVPI